MQVKIEKLPKSRVKLEIEALKEEIKQYFEEAYHKLSKQVTIKGFREGMAPKLMVIDSVGLNRYNSTALDIALPQIYYKAIESEKLVPISSPNVTVRQFAEDKDFIFTAEVDLVPQIKLGDYKSVRVKSKSKETDVTNEEIDKVVKRLLYQSAQFTEVDCGAQEGDNIEIEFTGSVKGVFKENYTSKNYPLILGEKVLIPGFEERLVGIKKGENKEFKLDVHSPIGGKEEVDFKVKMNAVRKVKLPQLDENFSKKFGQDTVEKLKDAIGKSIKSEKEQRDRAQLEQEILEKIASKSQLEVPDSLIDQEVSRKITQMQQQMGPVWDQYLQKMGKTVENLREELIPGAQKQVKFGLLLGEVARDMGFLKDNIKTQEEQEKVIHQTMDKLIEMATR